jgi:hypothetical protein
MLQHGWTLMLSEEDRHKIQFHLYEMSTVDKSIQTGSRLVVSRDWGKRRMESDC